MLQDGGLEFGTFFCLTIANGMKLNCVERRRKEELPELQGLLSCCSTTAELRAKCLFHPLRSQLDRVTYCWPPLTPAIAFDSIFVRHHEAEEKARGVNQASVYSSVFGSSFFFFFFIVLCSFPALLVERAALPENLVAPAASEDRHLKQSPEEANYLPACLSRFHLVSMR